MSNEHIVVTVEMSDGFEPGQRTAAAIAELVDALSEEHGDGDDVSGFSAGALRTFTFGSQTGAGRTIIGGFKSMSGLDSSLHESWPSEWKVSEMDGKSNDVL